MNAGLDTFGKSGNDACMDGSTTELEPKPVVDGPSGEARIVLLRPGEAGPCFVLIPGTGGRIEGFSHLADALETSVPVYAIEARGVGGSSTPDNNIEEMARHYLDRVRSVQPAGPYFLAGHSFGGIVAFEMAQRLVQNGESVPALMMLDTPIAKQHWPLRFYLHNLRVRILRHARRLFTISIVENFRYYFRRILLRRYGLLNIPPDIMIGSNVARVMIASEVARQKYKPQFYPGKLGFFRSLEALGFDELWRGHVAELEIHRVEGGHIDMIDPPFVASMAATMSKCLALSSAAPPSVGRASQSSKP